MGVSRESTRVIRLIICDDNYSYGMVLLIKCYVDYVIKNDMNDKCMCTIYSGFLTKHEYIS